MEKQLITTLNIIIHKLHYILLFLEGLFTELIIKTFKIAILPVADDHFLTASNKTLKTQPLIQISFDRGIYLFDFHRRLRGFRTIYGYLEISIILNLRYF